jgi:hypothetical protein
MLLKIAYLALNVLILFLLYKIGSKAIQSTFTNSASVHSKKKKLIASLLLWQVYIFVLARTGFLSNFDFPPRFVLLLIVPAFTFTGIFLYRNRNNAWIQNIAVQDLIYFQSFRVLLETLFVFSVAKGILHPNVTIEGYNFDMVYALTAAIVAFLVFNKKVLSIQVALVWNYIGLAVIASIIVVFFTTIYVPALYGSETTLMPLTFTEYPYITVAGFLMPSAVFIHVLSILQLRRKIRQNL